jgi:hypothetical protein
MGKFGEFERSGFAKMCARAGITEDLIDAVSLWDESLSHRENFARLHQEVLAITPILAAKEAEAVPIKHLEAQIADGEKREFARVCEEKKAFLDTLFAGKAAREGQGSEILEEIRQFNPHLERLTLSTLMAVNQGINVINLSPAGYGKSRGTKELLDFLNIPYSELTGHLAPTDFFARLRDARGLVVIDESATLLREPEILNLLLGALWGGVISWRDESAKVQCNIIFNTNSLPNSPFVDALKDRTHFNRLRLDSEKIRAKLISSFDYTPNKGAFAHIRRNIFIKAELTEDERSKLKEVLRAATSKSVRDRGRLEAQARFCKALFGSIDFVKLFVDIDATTAILMSGELSRAEKVKQIAEAEGVSVRTAQRIIKDEED